MTKAVSRPDWIDPDVEDKSRRSECSKCWYERREHVEGEHHNGHSQPPGPNRKPQEVEVLKCPQCDHMWSW